MRDLEPDQDLVERLKQGQSDAFDTFYRQYAPQVLAWAIRLGGPLIDADDVAQDVFSVALSRIHTFRGDSRLTTWLYSVTRNVIANARRRAAVRRWIGLSSIEEPVAPQAPVDDEISRRHQRRLVQEALETLSAKHREVLVLMDLEGRTAPEAAEMTGIPAGTLYSRLHYARRALVKALSRRGLGAADVLPGLPAGGRTP